MASTEPLRPTRRLIAAAVATAALLWVCALVLVNSSDGPVEVAERYLKALSEGDTASAESLIAEPIRESAPLLTDDALTTGWTAESVEVVSERKEGWVSDGQWNAWTVSYTIRYGDRTASGKLELSDREGSIQVRDPYVEASVSMGLGLVELNDYKFQPPGSGEVDVVMYPGVYRLFGSYPDLVDSSKAVLLAVHSDTWLNISRETEDIFAVSDDYQAEFDQALQAWIDDCVQQGEIAASGCPFSAAPHHSEEMEVDLTAYDDVADLQWQVEFYPVVELRASWNGLHAFTRVDGSIIITAEATRRYYPEDGTVEVEELCGISAKVEAGLTEEGELDLQTSGVDYPTC